MIKEARDGLEIHFGKSSELGLLLADDMKTISTDTGVATIYKQHKNLFKVVTADTDGRTADTDVSPAIIEASFAVAEIWDK